MEMKFTCCCGDVIFRSVIMLFMIVSDCHARCFHTARVGMVPGEIKFLGFEQTGCVWTLNSPNMKIELTVISTTFKDQDCSGSRLEIKDGTFFGGHIADICDNKPRTVRTEGHYIQIVYHASSSWRRDRFKLKYMVYDSSVCKAGYRLAETTEKSIASPNYPLDCPKNIKCLWLLDAGSDHKQVTITVKDSKLARKGSSCSEEYVEAFDGSSMSAKSLWKWCGGNRPTIESTGRYMFIGFSAKTETKAFIIGYSTTADIHALQSTHIGGIVGGITAGGFVVFAVAVCIYACCKGKCLGFLKRSPDRNYRSYPTPTSDSNVYSVSSSVRHRTTSLSSSISSQESLHTPPAPRDLPPAYDDVIKNEPPSYFQAISDDIHVAHPNTQNTPTIANNEPSG